MTVAGKAIETVTATRRVRQCTKAHPDATANGEAQNAKNRYQNQAKNRENQTQTPHP
jgi:hypothetical protein